MMKTVLALIALAFIVLVFVYWHRGQMVMASICLFSAVVVTIVNDFIHRS